MKTCTKCKQEKSLSEFHRNKSTKDGFLNQCIGCRKQYMIEWRSKNQDKMREQHRRWRAKNPGCDQKYYQRYLERNPNLNRDTYRKRIANNPTYFTEWDKRRRAIDPTYKLIRNLRRRLNNFVKKINRSESTIELIGCSIEEFMHVMESRDTWRDNWSWNNYGSDFVIDHIIPISKWDNPIEAFHYSNCQPLCPKENVSKKDKMPDEWQKVRLSS